MHTPQHHNAFNFLREEKIPSLNITVQEFMHAKTGAQHIHMQADNDENVFLVALRTVPEDSTGVAHILEHTALCGSRKYPVRDPFFMMTRRSLNTFMNAFTSSDWTAYPFSSFNKKDFNNLLDVYLDAVFFSRLDPLDFAQEGHRLEFQEADNPNSPLEFKGVVFNEMKGAMSSVSSQLWQNLTKYLYPSNTYHFNSGGEPSDIPDLSYEQLLAFYKSHYHPSNAIFMTFGNIPALEHQTKFEEQVLHAFDRLDEVIAVEDTKRFYAPIRVQESYANNDDDLSEKSHVVIGWLLGDSTNLQDTLRAQLLSSLLLDNSACPLLHALESSDLGNAPSPLCGLDDSQKELSFICGLADCPYNVSDAVETLILDTLNKIANEGIPTEDIDAALHQLELHQREITGDSYPYGLQLILKSLTSATHRGDPLALLDLDTALQSLREDLKDPNFIPSLLRSLLLDNPHRVRLTLTPDTEISARKMAAEKLRLEKIKQSLSESEKQAIVHQAAALKQRQEQVDDAGILPKVSLDDVPETERSANGTSEELGGHRLSTYRAGTNGLCYQQAIFTLPPLSENELKHLPLFSSCITELGAGKASYMDMQRKQTAVSGGVSAYSSIRARPDNIDTVDGFYIFSGKALQRNHRQLNELMAEFIYKPRFDETRRIQELVAQIRSSMEQSITGNGHVLAMSAAASGICATARLAHQVSGLEALRDIRTLDQKLSEGDASELLGKMFSTLHEYISRSPLQLLYIADEKADPSSFQAFKQTTTQQQSEFNLPKYRAQINDAWITNTQVNFCSKAYATVPMAHPDAAPLIVLGNFLRNGYLHKAIREQGGAYGGGASQDNNNACFRFYSYRDPRLEGTLQDFDTALRWLLDTRHSADKLEEAILGTISSLDRSESPAGQAKRCFHAELHGRTPELRQAFRARVLATSIEDLRRLVETYLSPDKAHTAVITSKGEQNLVEKLGLNKQML